MWLFALKDRKLGGKSRLSLVPGSLTIYYANRNMLVLDNIYNDMYRVATNQVLLQGLCGGHDGPKNDFHHGLHNARAE